MFVLGHLVSLLLLFLSRNIPGQKYELVGFEAYTFGKGIPI